MTAKQPSATMTSAISSTIYNGLDTFEVSNAAEWDEVPESQGSAEQQGMMPVMRLDEKVDDILEERGMAPASAVSAVIPTPPAPPGAPAKEPFKFVKTATCRFWATPSKKCRFTAEECRDLHAFLPTKLGESANFHKSKPIWGAPIASQSSPSMSHAYPDSICVPQVTNDFKGRTKTCWFWANGRKCNYTAEICKYLHEYTSEAVASRPAKILLPDGDARVGSSGRYRRVEGNSSGWGRARDKYKPPHIKALDDWASAKLIKVVNVADVPSVETSLKIERCEYLASYNWLDRSNYPTILVPGSPPLWSPSLSTKRLKEDSGRYFRDPNSARYPHYPTEPAFRALLAMHPDSDPSTFDIVGCGSTLGSLLRFCEGDDKDFRFDIDRVRDTVFFIRKESSPAALIPDICGYGHSFHEAHTMWEPEVKGSASHQRIIQYDFGGLKFLVRSESDGYLKQAADLDAHPNDTETAYTTEALLESNENLETAQVQSEADNCALLETLRVTGRSSSTVGPLHIEMRGRPVPQQAIFDLKTRAKETRRPIDMGEVYRRLWVNQTPYFIFAEHFRGSFEPRDIQPVSISDGISKWEKDHEALLKHYQATVMEIIAATRNSATGKLQVIRRGSGPLEIQERVSGDDADVLPRDIRSKW